MTDSLPPSAQPVRVGLNAQLLSLTETYRGAGINGYIHNLMQRLPAAAPDLHFTAFLNERDFAAPSGLALQHTHWPTGRPPVRVVWEQLLLPRLLRVLGIDLLHGLAYATPLASPCPTVVTVHDLTFFRFPKTLKPFKRCYLQVATHSATQRAARIIAVSQQTRDDLVQILQVPLEKVDVVHNGVSEAFHPVAAEDVAAFRQHRGLPPRFILFLGTLEPRKNVERLLEAFARWLKDRREMRQSVKLIVAGARGWYFERIFARAAQLGLADEVLFPGFLPAAELPWWYRAAECFVYPSLYEGFGLPVLEAMACGTPVITSSASSLPEVAGDAAIIVNPHDVAALAEAIGQVMKDAGQREKMRQAGLQQAARFPWRKAATETASVYRRALATGETNHG